MSVNPQAIHVQQSRPPQLIDSANASESKRNPSQAIARGSFANVLNESRQQMRAKLQQRENISPQQMFEKPKTASSRNPESIKQNGDQPSNNANQDEATSQNAQRLVNDRLRLDLQSRSSLSSSYEKDGRLSSANNHGRASGKVAQNCSDDVNPSHAVTEYAEAKSNQIESCDLASDNASDRQSTTGTSSSGAQTAIASSLNASQAPASSRTNLAEDLGQWLKSQMKQELSGVSADKLIIAPPTRSSSNPFGEAAKSPAAESQPAQPQMDDEPEFETSSRAIFNELVRSMRVRHDTRSSSAQIELDPPRLGPMRVDIKMEGDQLRMEVQTTNEEARELLTSKLADLKAALQNQGIKLDDVSVIVSKSITPLGESIAAQNPTQVFAARDFATQSNSNRTDSKVTKRQARSVSDRAPNDAHELFAASN